MTCPDLSRHPPMIADHWQGFAERQRPGSEGVSEVVQPDILQPAPGGRQARNDRWCSSVFPDSDPETPSDCPPGAAGFRECGLPWAAGPTYALASCGRPFNSTRVQLSHTKWTSRSASENIPVISLFAVFSGSGRGVRRDRGARLSRVSRSAQTTRTPAQASEDAGQASAFAQVYRSWYYL